MRFAHFGHVYFPVRVSNFCAAPNSRGLLTIFSYTLVFVLFRENVLAAVRFFASFWVLFGISGSKVFTIVFASACICRTLTPSFPEIHPALPELVPKKVDLEISGFFAVTLP